MDSQRASLCNSQMNTRLLMILRVPTAANATISVDCQYNRVRFMPPLAGILASL
jgi:hypothetical protein